MKYILTENQYRRISEISVIKGRMSVSDTYTQILDSIRNKVKDKTYYKAVKDYFKNVLGYPEKIKKGKIEDYAEDLFNGDIRNLPKEFRNSDVIANLTYHLAKLYLKVKNIGELECYIEKDSFGRTYYFFDPELEICIGYITCKNISGDYHSIRLPNDSYTVSTSQVDEGLSGRGYGKQMYFAIIEDVQVLLSDTMLYTDSLNIWVNVLPKYVYVGAIIEDKKKPRILTPKTPILDHDYVVRYFATKNPDYIKPSRHSYF